MTEEVCKIFSSTSPLQPFCSNNMRMLSGGRNYASFQRHDTTIWFDWRLLTRHWTTFGMKIYKTSTVNTKKMTPKIGLVVPSIIRQKKSRAKMNTFPIICQVKNRAWKEHLAPENKIYTLSITWLLFFPVLQQRKPAHCHAGTSAEKAKPQLQGGDVQEFLKRIAWKKESHGYKRAHVVEWFQKFFSILSLDTPSPKSAEVTSCHNIKED